ncbi:MAG: hypothetical protein GEV03_19295 [Streptosporangiales bacterium]|nr:hypothetical protein [Streptosporangiales bacterium]
MHGDGFRADPATLQDVAGRLHRAADDLEGGASPPPPPEAGAVTAAVNAVLSLQAESLAGVVDGLGASGNAVSANRDAYVNTDQNQAGSLASVE